MAVSTSWYPYQEMSSMTAGYGWIMADKVGCQVGDVCKYFKVHLYNPIYNWIWHGDPVTYSSGPIIQGGVWLIPPDTPGQRNPDYRSTNTFNVGSLPGVSGQGSSTKVQRVLTTVTFNFNEGIGATSGAIWIGIIGVEKGWIGYQMDSSYTNYWQPRRRDGKQGLWIEIDTNPLNPSVGPGIKPATILITNWTPITKNMGYATINWNGMENGKSRTTQSINGSSTNGSINSGDDPGYRLFTPSDFGVQNGVGYNVTVTRSNDLPSSASDSVTLYTYTNPSVSNLQFTSPAFTVQNNIINANHNLGIKWTSNTPANDGKSTRPRSNNPSYPAKATNDKHKTTLKVKNTMASEVNNTSSGTTVQTTATISSTNLMKYVPFDASKAGGESVTLTITKSHVNDTSIASSSVSKNVTVRYIPTEKIVWPSSPQTGFRLNGASGTILQTNSVVDKATSNTIYVYFTYPTGERGIIDGYRIRIKQSDNTWVGPYYITTNRANPNLSPSINIPTTDLKYGLGNTIYVDAYYQHTNGQKYYGPVVSKGFPSVITKMSTPTIDYPKTNCQWINKNFRVLLTLPNDPDWNEYPTSITNNYLYRDIQIKVNNITYSYLNNPTLFSVTKLGGHKIKVAINPSLASNFPNATTYNVQIRVRKNYGYTDSQEEQSWSSWSSIVVVNVVPATHSVNRGDLILADHFNKMKTLLDRMRVAYPAFTVTTPTVKRGDYILADPFTKPYQDIKNCMNVVNNWGTYASNRNSVKFNNGNPLPSYTPTKGEYVTALAEDTKFPGRNYMTLMFNYANLLK